MKKLFLFFAISPLFIFSQNNISGNLKDSLGSIEFANVILTDLSNKIVTGTITDDKGHFEIQTNEGKYNLTISFIGYKDWVKQISVESKIDLGDIKLIRSVNNLNEITIISKTPIIERKADRIVFNVENSILSSGKSSLELLSLSPNVWVSNSGSISLNGVQGVKILINGILLKLSGNQLSSYLNSLNATQIKKIEIIQNPPAEYEAEGSAGLINIILKKEKKDGLTGSVFTGYKQGKYSYFENGFNLNYKKGKLGFYGQYYFIKDKKYADTEELRVFSNTDVIIKNESNSTPIIHNQQLRFGIDLAISKNQYLGAEVIGTFNKKKTPFKSFSSIFNNSKLDSTIIGDYNLSSKNTFYNVSVNYNIEIDTLGANIKISSDYVYNDSKDTDNFISSFFQNNLFFKDKINRNNVPTTTNIYSYKIDFYKPLNKNELNIGAKYSNTQIDNEIVYENFIDNSWKFDVTKSNQFNYTENIFASYLSYTTSLFNIDTKIGLRGEYATIDGNSETVNQYFKKEKFDLFPSLFMKYDLNKDIGNSLSFYYGRRINRPSFENLNPFIYQIDDFTSSVGNSDLNPQYSNTIQLNFDYHRKYSLSVFFSKTSDVFTQIALNEEDNRVIYQVQNLNNSENYGASLNLPIEFTKWWKSYNNASLYQNSFSFNNYNNSKLTFEGKSNHYFTISESLSLELNGGFQSKTVLGNFKVNPNYYIDFGVRKYFWNKKGQVKISATDIFNTRNTEINVDFKNLNLVSKEKNQSRTIMLSLIYNFSTGKEIKVKRTDSGNWDERERL
ncbi:MAG: outer membrane beta-barrel family protein [bacterium]|nr:outer membrane beta-barrel family protein [bacterium]